MGRAVPGRKPVVLVVEDENLIRLSALDMVEEAGFEAILRPMKPRYGTRSAWQAQRTSCAMRQGGLTPWSASAERFYQAASDSVCALPAPCYVDRISSCSTKQLAPSM